MTTQPTHAGSHYGYPKLPAVPHRQPPWLPKTASHPMSATTMAIQSQQPPSIPNPKCTANPLPNRTHARNHHNHKSQTTTPTQNTNPHIANHHNRKPQTTTPIQNTNPHIANHHNHKPQTTTPTQNTNPHIANHHTNKKPPNQQPSQPITTSQQTHFAQTQAKELLLGLTCKTNVFFFAIREVSDLGDYFDRVVCGVVSLTAECGLEDGFGFSSGPGGFDLL
jgi:hypothetical protein